MSVHLPRALESIWATPMPDQMPNPTTATQSSASRLELGAYEELLKDPRPLGRVFVGLMAIHLAVDWVTAFSSIWKERISGFMAVDSAYLLLMALIYFVWIYRCVVNAQRLDRVMSPTPGIAIGGYFIPIFNLVGPYIAMKRMVAVSFRRSLRPTIVKWVLPWWIFVLFWAALMVVSAVGGFSTYPELIGCVVESVMVICLGVIVLRLSAAQSEIRVLAVGKPQHLGQSVTLRHSGVSADGLEVKPGAAGIPVKRSGLPPRRSNNRR